MPLDSPNGNTAIGNAMVLTPGGKRSQQSPIDVRSIYPKVASHFFKVDAVDLARNQADLPQPALEAEIPHAAALKALGLEVHKTVVERGIAKPQSPTRGGTQIKGKNRRMHRYISFGVRT
jgi:hypothetical protein